MGEKRRLTFLFDKSLRGNFELFLVKEDKLLILAADC